MTTENQPPAPDTNTTTDVFDEALASVPAASPPVPSVQAPEPAPELGVPPPTATPEGSTPPLEIPVPPLSPDAIALQEKQAEIDALTQSSDATKSLLQQYQVEQRKTQVDSQTSQFAQQLISDFNDGTLPQKANQWAQVFANSQVQGQEAAQEAAAKATTIRQFATQYGVPEDILAVHESPQAMQIAAQQAQKIMALEKQLSETRQTQLPTQVFDNSMGLSTGMTEAQRKAASGRGEYTPTPEEHTKWLNEALNKVPGFGF